MQAAWHGTFPGCQISSSDPSPRYDQTLWPYGSFCRSYRGLVPKNLAWVLMLTEVSVETIGSFTHGSHNAGTWGQVPRYCSRRLPKIV